jgi:predicted ABC-type ATPase
VPVLTVVAGPNGSGKSTLTRWVEFEGREELIDPDALARDMRAVNPPGVAIAAGRKAIRRIRECLRTAISFAIETTLAGRSSLALMSEARSRGYEIHLLYIALDSPERSIARIRTRAARGGHFIPPVDVRRRYARSIANLAEAIGLADIAEVYDNSGSRHRVVLAAKAGVVVWRTNPLPGWMLKAL